MSLTKELKTEILQRIVKNGECDDSYLLNLQKKYKKGTLAGVKKTYKEVYYSYFNLIGKPKSDKNGLMARSAKEMINGSFYRNHYSKKDFDGTVKRVLDVYEIMKELSLLRAPPQKNQKKKTEENKKVPFSYPEEITTDEEHLFSEGAKTTITVNKYERDPKARQACIKKYGYNCQVCKLNFEKEFGEIGKNFIHVHHLKPLKLKKESHTVTPETDLVPVCPNCHAMLHRTQRPWDLNNLENIIKKIHH